MIKGESRPVPRSAGQRIVVGTVATDSAIRVRIDPVGADTALACIQHWWPRPSRPGAGPGPPGAGSPPGLFYIAATF